MSDGPDFLAMNGIPSGGYIDGSVGYAGMTYSSNCSGLPSIAGRLTSDPVKPGGYFVCNDEFYVTDNLKYVENHPKISWCVKTPTQIGTDANIIKFSSGNESLAFGKTEISGFIYVGRVRHNHKFLTKFQ